MRIIQQASKKFNIYKILQNLKLCNLQIRYKKLRKF
jgi:hypothetical protein